MSGNSGDYPPPGDFTLPTPSPEAVERIRLDQLSADLIRRAAVLDHLAAQLETYAAQLAAREREVIMRENDVIKASEQMAQWRREHRNTTQNERRRANGRR